MSITFTAFEFHFHAHPIMPLGRDDSNIARVKTRDLSLRKHCVRISIIRLLKRNGLINTSYCANICCPKWTLQINRHLTFTFWHLNNYSTAIFTRNYSSMDPYIVRDHPTQCWWIEINILSLVRAGSATVAITEKEPTNDWTITLTFFSLFFRWWLQLAFIYSLHNYYSCWDVFHFTEADP